MPNATDRENERKNSMTTHHIFQTTDRQEVGLIAPDHAQINIGLNSANSSKRGIVNTVDSSPFNEGDDTKTKENQVVTQNKSELFRIVPAEIELFGATSCF